MTYLLARLDAALTRIVTCVADKVFGAIADTLQSWDQHDGAVWLTDWEAEHEVHEPAPKNCPLAGPCPPECDRTHAGCVLIWGSDTDHAEAVERNRFYTSMKTLWNDK